MNPSTTSLTLNMQLPNIATVAWAVQGDQLSRHIEATLVDGSTAWNPQSGYAALVRYFKPDGTNGVYDTDEDGNPAVTWTGNVATITLAHQAMTVAGTVIMQLEFYDANDARITAFGWAMNVQPSAVTDTEFLSTDYYNILTLQIAGVLAAATHPPYINSTNKNWMIFDAMTNSYVDSGFSSVGETGPAPEVTSTSYEYANSNSSTTLPSSWSSTRPETSPGTWAWTKTTITFDTNDTTVLYSCAYQGNDGQGAPSSATPLADSDTGVVGTATAYSRGDHQHPINVPTTGTPEMDGTAALGSASTYARSDHVHPSDTSKADQTDVIAINEAIANKVLYLVTVPVTATTGNIVTVSNSAITADHVLVSYAFAEPSYIVTDFTWTTVDESFTINGTCTTATTVNLVLIKKDN